AAIKRAFAIELAAAQIQDVTAERDIAVIAAVGEGMAGTPGIAARFFRAIAQGASERNISAAIAAKDATRALRAVHAGFYLSPQTLSVGVIGPGQVGRALLKQLAEAAPGLRERTRLELRLRAVSDSKKMRLSQTGLDTAKWTSALDGDTVPVDLD